MKSQQLRELILKQLPTLMQEDPAFREAVLQISRSQFADKAQTEDRFDRMMAELVKNRELLEQKMKEDHQKWEENRQQWQKNEQQWQKNEQQWQKNEQKWQESQRKWEENQQKWQENEQKWQESQRKWEENQQKLKENDRKWAENQQVLLNLSNSIKELSRKQDSTIGALGARWGLHSEASFRNALAGILAEFPEVEVLNVTERDEQGVVFGYPEQIEFDLIVKNGLLMICEIKSSVSKSEMYIFEKKVRFYEQKHHCQAQRMLVISPMVDSKALPVAQRLGIEVYSYAQDVSL